MEGTAGELGGEEGRHDARMSGPALEKLQDVLGHRFRQPELLHEALTHSSFVQEDSCQGRDNERLEFLGDSVLNFLVSARLVEAFPQWEEGKLSKARAHLVTAAHLARVASKLDLGEYLRLGRGEERTGGRHKPALRVDALEALVAALYSDGGLEAARAFVNRFVLPEDVRSSAEELFSADHKSALQEHLQASHLAPARYRIVDETGPEHRKVFTVEAVAAEGAKARGRGRSKKAAEQQAAGRLLKRLRNLRQGNE